ncbi:MAG: Gfo/Idh/MocA family oxidoreductase [Oscillospiraceae bacterium]|nr:Gfo/Idh/MocA family oxidoreductase [Oscillospiraceae bacterium]
MVKIGIVGCGGIANGKHMPSLKKLSDIEMVAFCDIIPERAAKAAAEYGAEGAKTFTDYHELLKIKDIEVVHVLTPNISHAEISIAAMEAGKHVMCEKPMAKTAAEARKMLDVHKKTGKLLSIGYNGRSDASQMYARKLVADGVLGDIYYTRAVCLRRRGVPCWGVFLNKEAQGGGPIIDIATHSVDRVMWLTGNYDVKSVTAKTFLNLGKTPNAANAPGWGTWKPEDFEVEDSAFAFVQFENGMIMNIECSWMINLPEDQFGSISLCGTKAGIDFSDGLRLNGEADGILYLNKIQVESHQRPRRFGDRMTGVEYDAWQWIEAVKGNGEPMVKPEEALVVSEILEAIYTSSKTGKTIEFKDRKPV